jgi:hypothetical protein
MKMLIGRRRLMAHNVFMVFLLLLFVSPPGGVIGNNQGELGNLRGSF